MSLEFLKKQVKLRRINNKVKYANLLARAIAGYEKSRCTKDWLEKYYIELEYLSNK